MSLGVVLADGPGWDFEAYRDLGNTLAQTMVDLHRVAARLHALTAPSVRPSPNGQTGTESETATLI